MSGLKLGLVGLGKIGEKCARRAAGFDIEIGYHNRSEKKVPYRYFDRVDALAQWADFLIVATPGGAGTRHLIDRAVLDALGPGGFVVNVSRGSVVDTAALAEALREGRIAGAGLDVFEHEPAVSRKLRRLAQAGRVTLLPHMGSATIEGRVEMGQRVILNIQSFADGHRPPDRVLRSML